MSERLADALRPLYHDPGDFSRVLLPRQALRPYQAPVARDIAAAVEAGAGGMFVVVFSRQAGKDELLAQLVAYLLTRYEREGGEIVVAAPTLEPQAMITMDRVWSRMKAAALSAARVKKDGDTIRLGRASARFMSADPSANPRGATASLLLVANEAQDIDPAIWDARFDPMAASTNAVTVFMGTVWTSAGLLDRQQTYLEETDPERVFLVDWERVAAIVPAYGDRVRARIAQFGIDHPYIKTEYRLITLDAEGGLFPPARTAQFQGGHQRMRSAADGPPGGRYGLLIDVAGEDESDPGPQSYDLGSRRDSTALTVVRAVDVGDALPAYEVVDRRLWTGVKHITLLPQLVDLARNVWAARAVVIDASGVGAGLASFLAAELDNSRRGRRIHVEKVAINQAVKSKMGFGVIGLMDTGRIKDHVDDGSDEWRAARAELAAVEYEILPVSGMMRWGVPASKGHDDLTVSLALAPYLDELDWRPRGARGTSGATEKGPENPA